MALIAVGAVAPPIRLETQFGTLFDLASYRDRSLVLLLFYPRDWTPTCSQEVPGIDRLANRFALEAKTQPVAISTDSWYSHNAWCADIGGAAYPVLSDSNPLGAVSQAYGAWVAADQTSDRATVLIGPDGKALYSYSVGVDGRRNPAELLKIAKEKSAAFPNAQVPFPPPVPFRRPADLYIRSDCPLNLRVLRAAYNLAALRDINVYYVERNPAALARARSLNPQGRVPLMVSEDGVLVGKPIISSLVARYGKFAR